MPTEQLEADVCCEPMAELRKDDYCYIVHLDSDGMLTACDMVDSERLPPLEFCPWCGTRLDTEEYYDTLN